MYKKERFLTSNTAMLANTCLVNSEIYLRGFEDSTIPNSFLDEENYQPLYLFPDEDAQELTDDYLAQFDRPINLIVPDGTWRQAKKIHKREKNVSHIQRVKVTNIPKTIYPLRQQKYDYGLCTLEAIAYALGIIEDKSIQDSLLNNLKIMIERHTKYRGYLKEKLKKNILKP
jgi:DTW domain-containing protein YfiP